MQPDHCWVQLGKWIQAGALWGTGWVDVSSLAPVIGHVVGEVASLASTGCVDVSSLVPVVGHMAGEVTWRVQDVSMSPWPVQLVGLDHVGDNSTFYRLGEPGWFISQDTQLLCTIIIA